MSKEKNIESGHSPARHPMIGLALGSGLGRGFAHIGVIEVLEEHGIRPGIIAGSSIGSLVGGCYLAGKIDEFKEWALDLNRMKVFSYLDFRVRSAGLIGGKRLVNLLEEHFEDMTIPDLGYPFVSIATDLVTGHEVWLRKESLIDAMRASFALPGVFPPVEINHRRLIDGALVNPLPVSACRALGAHLIIAVDLNADLMGKAAKPGQNYQTIAGFDLFGDESAPKGLAQFSLTRRLFGREANSPSLFGVMVSALNIIQDRLTRSRLAGDPPDVHIKPEVGDIGVLEFERAEELIQRGREAAEEMIPEIKEAVEVLLPQIERPPLT